MRSSTTFLPYFGHFSRTWLVLLAFYIRPRTFQNAHIRYGTVREITTRKHFAGFCLVRNWELPYRSLPGQGLPGLETLRSDGRWISGFREKGRWIACASWPKESPGRSRVFVTIHAFRILVFKIQTSQIPCNASTTESLFRIPASPLFLDRNACQTMCRDQGELFSAVPHGLRFGSDPFPTPRLSCFEK